MSNALNSHPGHRFSEEMESLLSLCRSRIVSGRTVNPTVVPLSLRPDFFRVVRFHRMLPFIFPSLKEHAWYSIPKDMQEKVERMLDRQKLKSMQITAELVTIAKQFNQKGLEIICLKGPLMTMELYGNILDRHQGDIDLLGSVQDLDMVRSLLAGLGYQVPGKVDNQMLSTPRRLKAYMKSTQHIIFINREKKVVIEFHYRLFKNPHLLPIPVHQLRRNLREVEYGGARIKRLSLIDSALHMIVHGSNHEWYRLKWLVDIAYLTRQDGLDWQALNERAIDFGVERMVLQALQLANKLLGVEIPGAIQPADTPNALIDGLVQRAIMKINSCHQGPDLERKVYLGKLRRGVRYKKHILWMQLHLDFHQTGSKLPDGLFFLHYLINPFLWFYRKYVGKHIRKRIRRRK